MFDAKTNEFIAGFSLDYQNVNKYRHNSISKSRHFISINGERNLFQIFFKPRLKIEFDKNQSARFKPQLKKIVQDKSIDIDRKWLKIKIRNEGSVTAINCRAKLDIIEGNSPIRPADTKRLIWDEFATTIDIYPKDNGEYCHVVFSDTNFSDNIAAMISSSLLSAAGTILYIVPSSLLYVSIYK
jgi:hypothetical protein